MTVLHVISSIDPRKGGPVLALQGLARAQRKLGLDVAVVATYSADNRADALASFEEVNVPVTLIGPTWGKLGFSEGMDRTLRDAVASADLVHIHAVWEEVQHLAARHAQALRKPYVFRPCGMLDPWSLAQHRWVKRLAWMVRVRLDVARASVLHATSETEAENLRQLRLGVPVIVEPNGVRLSEFASLPERGWLGRRVPALAGRRAVLFLGRIHYKKGLDLLIPAFAAVAAEHDDVDLVIAGPDNDHYLPEVRRWVTEHALDARVHVLGMLRGMDRVSALRDASLFVLPSRQENFGITVVEAMAAGTPVIISNEVALHPEVSAADAGEVVPLQVEALADAMRRWLADPSRCSAAGERGRVAALQRFTWSSIAERWRDHYLRLLAAQPVVGSTGK